jgi:hypothetical protein
VQANGRIQTRTLVRAYTFLYNCIRWAQPRVEGVKIVAQVEPFKASNRRIVVLITAHVVKDLKETANIFQIVLIKGIVLTGGGFAFGFCLERRRQIFLSLESFRQSAFHRFLTSDTSTSLHDGRPEEEEEGGRCKCRRIHHDFQWRMSRVKYYEILSTEQHHVTASGTIGSDHTRCACGIGKYSPY